MTCSLFSSFDPSMSMIGISSQFKWFYALFTICFIGWNFFIGFSSIILIIKVMILYILEMMMTVFKMSYKVMILMISSLFLVILSLNEIGLIPFFFTPTSHLVFNLSLALPLWMGGMIYMFYKSWMSALAHLVPSGCPMILIPFLIFIETISLIIRPFSLSVRLMSNIMAGHMIMTLIGSAISKCSMMMGISAIFAQSMLLTFEIGVVFIQAYVFMSLLFLYWEENN